MAIFLGGQKMGHFHPLWGGFSPLWGPLAPTGATPSPTGGIHFAYERTPIPYGSDAICLREDPRPLREGHFSPMGDDILWGAKMGVPAEMK